MKRDMDLIRAILLKIEEEYEPGANFMFGVQVEGYDLSVIAEHCDQLHQKGFIKFYKPLYGEDRVQGFTIGNITSSGYDYLDLIRNDSIWEKTKQEMEKKKVPQTFEHIAKIAGVFLGNMIKELNG